MADHNLPTLTSTYTNFVSELDGRLDDIARLLASDTVTATNLPTGAIRWSAASNTFQKWSGSAWAALTSSYSININGTVGATTAAAGAFTTLTTSGVASLAANSTVDGKIIATLDASQTLSNKTLDSPTIDDIVVTGGTLQLPAGPDTLVGAAAQQTLTNKTLTAPKFADGGFIADPNGNEILEFDSVASAVNHIAVLNNTTGNNPAILAAGANTNINLNLRSKGSGVVQINGVTAVDINVAQTLQNKTLGTGCVWNGNAIGVGYGGTGNTSNFTQGGVTYASSTTALATTAAGTSGQLLQSNGTGAPTWVNASSLTVSAASTATSATTSGLITAIDDRTISPSELATQRIRFGFGSWSNNNTTPYADFIQFRTYTDSSGGNDNLLMIRKDALGMRLYQQTFGSATAYSSFKDIAWTDGSNATGTWAISINGNAATATTASNGGVTSVNGQTGAVTVSAAGIGIGQTWQVMTDNETPTSQTLVPATCGDGEGGYYDCSYYINTYTQNRLGNTWYQNTTGKPIMVTIWGQTNGSASIQIGSSTTNFVTILTPDGDSGEWQEVDPIIIPVNHYYRHPNNSFKYWWELR